jgi:hypothetical protein
MTVNNIAITNETIIATRSHFINICNACILGACSNEFRVNDLRKYIEWEKQHISRYAKGEGDNTLTFLQRALWLQTGEMVAILP